MSELRAWSVAVLAVTPHGQSLACIFVLAATRAEALAAGVRHVAERAFCPDKNADCVVNIAMTQVTEIARDTIFAAAKELGIDDRERTAAQSDE